MLSMFSRESGFFGAVGVRIPVYVKLQYYYKCVFSFVLYREGGPKSHNAKTLPNREGGGMWSTMMPHTYEYNPPNGSLV